MTLDTPGGATQSNSTKKSISSTIPISSVVPSGKLTLDIVAGVFGKLNLTGISQNWHVDSLEDPV